MEYLEWSELPDAMMWIRLKQVNPPRYSCSLLTACWHLLRLGVWDMKEDYYLAKKNNVSFVGQNLITVLPRKEYMQVEANTNHILRYCNRTKFKKGNRLSYILH